MQHRAHSPLPGLSRLLLDPLSLLYKAAAYADWRIKRARQRAFPGLYIVSADGLSFGGSGKTPLVMAIGTALAARGARFAVVSRGYRSRHEREGLVVGTGHDSAAVGDEPMMLKARFPDQDVLIGRDRLRSIALAQARGNRFVILDDGLQSGHIRKDFSVLLVNPAHPYYYLRHFRCQQRRADRVLVYRPAPAGTPATAGTYGFAITGFLDAGGEPVEVGAAPLVAFSALGDNERFAADMRRWHLAAYRPFPDHHAYSAADLRDLESLRQEKRAAWLVCTEKDFCKLKGLLAPGPLSGNRVEARRDGLQGLPLLYTRNEIQLPHELLEQIINDAAKKGFL
jgi:tetraacyldisaccharide 4'-kinase